MSEQNPTGAESPMSLESFFQQASQSAPAEEPPAFAMPSLSADRPVPPPANSAPLPPPAAATVTSEAPAAPKDVTAALQLMKSRLSGGAAAKPAAGGEVPKAAAPVPAAAPAAVDPTAAKPPEIWEYRVGQAVFREGELTFELFMLMEGVVDIYVGDTKVATLDADKAAGAYLGEIGALLRTPRTATVKAVKPCKFLVFPDVRRLFAEDPEFGFKLSSILAQRLTDMNERKELVLDALHKAKVKPEVLESVQGAFQGKKSMYFGKKGLFG